MSMISVPQLLTVLKIIEGTDIRGMIKAFESDDLQSEIINGAIGADVALKLAGVFFAPAAVAANDLEIAIAVEPYLAKGVMWLASQPVAPLPPGKISVWGATMDDPNWRPPARVASAPNVPRPNKAPAPAPAVASISEPAVTALLRLLADWIASLFKRKP